MSKITSRFKDTFAYAIRDGSEMCILPNGLALLATFTFMKAVVANHAIIEENDKSYSFFTRPVRERFGRSLEIPPVGIRMWIGAFQGEALYGGRCVPALLSGNGPLQDVQFLTFTYVVGHLVLQLCASRWKDIHYRRHPVIPMLRPDPFWDEAAVQFWPLDGFPINWPPPKYFGDEMIQQLIDRFMLPVAL